MNLNPSTMRLGIASILVGLVGAYGVRVMMEEEEAPAAAKEDKIISVPVASANLPTGRILRIGDIGLVPMTRDQINEKGWVLSEMMMDPQQIEGRELIRAMRAGSPFLTSEVYLEGYRYPIELKPGMRAVQVRVANDHGGGEAMRGDTVDLFFTTNPKEAEKGGIDVPFKTIKVADAVKILHVDHPELSEIQWAVGYKEKAPIFTLEVDPDTVGKVAMLKNVGNFSLTLRSGDEPAGRSSAEVDYDLASLLGIEEPAPPQQPPVQSVEYWYGRQRSMKYFPVPQPTAEEMAQHQAAAAAAPASSRQPVADVLPDAPRPAAQSNPTTPTAVPPYRPDPTPSVTPPTPPTPSRNPSAAPPNAGRSDDPFKDDSTSAFDAGDVIP